MKQNSEIPVFTDKNGDSYIPLPAPLYPAYRVWKSHEDKVSKNILLTTWGGIGDQICAEPTLRYALKQFKGCEVSLASEMPELFSHLNFHRVFNTKKELPVSKNYLVFQTIVDDSSIVWQFFSHMLTNCVDFPSLCALRCQLPSVDKQLMIRAPDEVPKDFNKFLYSNKFVVVHPGRHWRSKTFPKDWWDTVLNRIVQLNKTPVLIGTDADDNRGTVDVNDAGCIDLRNKTSVMETIWLLQNSKVLLTNDSSPLHMAATGNAWIGYVATCKHPDLITHWRHGQFGWRMQNHGKSGVWDIISHAPNTQEKVSAEYVDPEILRSWLPSPNDFAEWAVSKTEE